MEETQKTGRELLKMLPRYVSHVWKCVGSVSSKILHAPVSCPVSLVYLPVFRIYLTQATAVIPV